MLEGLDETGLKGPVRNWAYGLDKVRLEVAK